MGLLLDPGFLLGAKFTTIYTNRNGSKKVSDRNRPAQK
jgi:hypothetical protein